MPMHAESVTTGPSGKLDEGAPECVVCALQRLPKEILEKPEFESYFVGAESKIDQVLSAAHGSRRTPSTGPGRTTSWPTRPGQASALAPSTPQLVTASLLACTHILCACCIGE